MKLGILTTAILFSATLQLVAKPTRPQASQISQTSKPSQLDSSTLNLKLQQAICVQDGNRAIKVLDRMVAAVCKQPVSRTHIQMRSLSYP